MRVIRNDPSRAARTDAPIFRGEVYRDQLVGETETKQVAIGFIRFTAGGRNVFHTHTFDQVLYVTEGEGIVATENEEQTIRPGDVAVIPAGERHWHGATERTAMTHLAIGIPGTTEIVS